ncbi:DUF2254 domain-containing protein [Nocardioides bruguierae]|uniref:DUF2254 domain-containing protein n=1 Tax=Nocardioides bruguierae TaxID=2945102 RepID=UPI0020217DAC|nr:DUF2254 domain-containing protein [Nocardioides bruguierae]MCL8025539.1 DUF2254 domain-containing protein [Nocardioides bruguierae]
MSTPTSGRPRAGVAPVTPPPSRRLPGRGRHLLRRLLRPFWVVPTLWTVLAIALGLAAPEIGALRTEAAIPWLFPGDVEGARSVLSTIAGAMISVTGLVFSNTMVVLQLASSQYSPRVLRTFLEDRVTQHTLGLFAGSFVYALTVLRSIEGSGAGDVPQVAVTLAYAWVVAALAMFLGFINHITGAVGVDRVLEETTHSTRALLEESLSTRARQRGARADEAPAAGADDDLDAVLREARQGRTQHVVTGSATGYLDGVLLAELVRCAAEADVLVEVLHPLGTFVVEGDPVALVHADGASTDDAREELEETVCAHLVVEAERTLEQDVAFGFRRLVDIAEKALSPGVNDPTTAVQTLDRLHELLRLLAVVDDPLPVHADDEGVPRVVTREPGFAGFLDLAVDEIAHYGAEDVQVPRRLARMLESLGAVATPAHAELIAAKAAAVRSLG